MNRQSRSVRAIRLVFASGILLFGVTLSFDFSFPRYFYPQLGAVDESTLGAVLATRIYELSRRGVIRPAAGDGPSLVICFEPSGEFSQTASPYFLSEPFSMFSALARSWDLRGALLDKYLPRAIFHHHLNSEMGISLVFRPETVYAVCRERIDTYLKNRPFLRYHEEGQNLQGVAEGLLFKSNCQATTAVEGNWPTLRIVAVSPLVGSPYSLNEGVASVAGFFLAEELKLAGHDPLRRVTYQIARPLRVRCTPQLGRSSWRWEIEIPESYWSQRFPFRTASTLMEKGRCFWLHTDTGYRFSGLGTRF